MAHSERGLRRLRDPESPGRPLGGTEVRRQSRKRTLLGKTQGFPGCLVGIMVNRQACRGKLTIVLVALVVLGGFQPGFAETQDIDQLRKAAEQGDACAQSVLGLMYAMGEEIPENYREAGKWFRLAADQGHAEAQFNLGFMYANGEGVPEDYVKAYIWGNLAAAQVADRVVKPEDQLGAGESIKFKDWLKTKMTAEQVAEAQKLSVDLFNRIESTTPDSPKRDCSSMQPDRLPSTPLAPAEPAWKGHQEIDKVLKESTTLPDPIDIDFVSKNVTPPTLLDPIDIHYVSRNVTSPTVLSRIEPVYSEKARKAKLQGVVVLSAIVRKDGSLEVLKVVRGLGLVERFQYNIAIWC